MRNILEVIREIKKTVPKGRIGLHDELDKHLTRCSYKAPEQMHDMWVMLAEIVNRNLLDESWKLEMVNILRDTK